ncbi:MAG: hypothetical protein IPL72_17550 [Sulfuritalea sp.]|nr:hypothetical protein [Sulfuritalea sp.]
MNPADSPLGDEGGFFVVLEAVFSEPTGDAMPRAPPVSGASHSDEPDYLRSEPRLAATAQNLGPSLTDQALAPVLEQAIRLWIAGDIDGSRAERLASLEVRIVDLPTGILGQADGDLILIDADADGFGWFVDSTPGESSEYEVTLSGGQLIADTGSDAFDRIDLLTVLVHEIGHVVGFDHDSDLAVMDADLSVGRRIELADTDRVGSLPVTSALTLDPLAVLNGSSDAGPITFRIFDDIANLGDDPGVLDVEVTGADSGNLIYNDVSSLIGSLLSFADQIVVDIDAYVKWNLSGLNAGTVTVSGYATISFSQVENITGALTANDAFIVGDLGGVTGTIDDRGGSTGLDVGNGALVAVIPDTFITWTNSTGDVLTGNSNLGTAGTLANANVRKITFSGANLFVGSGAALNATGSGIITTNAVGFAASGASLSMASVTTATEGFHGVQASVSDAGLTGVAGFELYASGTLKLNQTSRVDDERIDWTNASTTPGGLLPAMAITKTQHLNLTGSAAVDIGGGALVATVSGVELNLATMTVTDGVTTLTGADVLSFTGTAALFAGTGGSLNGAHTVVNNGTIGFAVSGVTLSLVMAKGALGDGANAGDTYVGVSVALTDAELIGVSGLELYASGTLKLNAATDGITTLDLPTRMNWTLATADANDPSFLLTNLDIIAALELQVTGSAAVDIGNGALVATVSGVELNLATMTVTDGVTTLTGADVLSFTGTAALFAGTGGSLNGAHTVVNNGTIGFAVSGVTLSLVMAKGALGDGANAGDTYVGVSVALTDAELIGVSGLRAVRLGHAQGERRHRRHHHAGPADAHELDAGHGRRQRPELPAHQPGHHRRAGTAGHRQRRGGHRQRRAGSDGKRRGTQPGDDDGDRRRDHADGGRRAVLHRHRGAVCRHGRQPQRRAHGRQQRHDRVCRERRDAEPGDGQGRAGRRRQRGRHLRRRLGGADRRRTDRGLRTRAVRLGHAQGERRHRRHHHAGPADADELDAGHGRRQRPELPAHQPGHHRRAGTAGHRQRRGGHWQRRAGSDGKRRGTQPWRR